ncbi:MAG: NGG1p interacting factor NIF3 [Clostridia bacterium]|jgi:putative NIF3 family GTP cyclohydrolase 1 type 2|nr:NGG1p interacting factor NIF3 [Clostridia bacterium]
MLLQEIYRLAVQMGMEKDPRGKAAAKAVLDENKKKFDEMKEEEQKEFDQEQLSNPYSDTRILYGKLDRPVKRVLAGIDIEVGEVLLADRLQNIDLIVAHHPEGKAFAALHDVMHLQEDIMEMLGVPINVAESLMSGRISEVQRGLSPINHQKTVDAARLLDIAFMCVHTPADNLVNDYLTNFIEEKQPKKIADLIKVLKEIPEYANATKNNAGPQVFVGSKERRCGKIVVNMTGGTSGSEAAYEKLVQAGVGTIVEMHMSEKHRKEAEKAHLNVVVAGHIASDSLGMNLFLDALEQRGIEVLACSGLDRVSRNA